MTRQLLDALAGHGAAQLAFDEGLNQQGDRVKREQRLDATWRASASRTPMRSMKWLIKGSGPRRSQSRVKPAPPESEVVACERVILSLLY